MGFQFNGLKAQVTISGALSTALPVPSSSQTIRTYSGSPNLTANYQTVLTPTATKTFYITAIIAATGTSTGFYIADNGTELYHHWTTTSPVPVIVPLPTPIAITTSLQLKSSQNTSSDVTIVGFEQ